VHDKDAEPAFVEQLEPHLDVVGSARVPPPTEIGLTNGSISSVPVEGCSAEEISLAMMRRYPEPDPIGAAPAPTRHRREAG
jgi:hypothetical protein